MGRLAKWAVLTVFFRWASSSSVWREGGRGDEGEERRGGRVKEEGGREGGERGTRERRGGRVKEEEGGRGEEGG